MIKQVHIALPAAASPVLQDSLNAAGQQGSGTAYVFPWFLHKGIEGWETNNVFQAQCQKLDTHQLVSFDTCFY